MNVRYLDRAVSRGLSENDVGDLSRGASLEMLLFSWEPSLGFLTPFRGSRLWAPRLVFPCPLGRTRGHWEGTGGGDDSLSTSPKVLVIDQLTNPSMF